MSRKSVQKKIKITKPIDPCFTQNLKLTISDRYVEIREIY